jgi:hypothetical protein
VTLSDRISTLSGTVRNADGQPAPMATVAVFPVDTSLWRVGGMTSRRVHTVAPQRNGTFSIRGLPSGEYYVVAAEWSSADFSDANVLTALMTSARRVSIGDGDTQVVDLRVVVK